jgi:predicted flap endonuclease-1-like 5' DNA nuclease
VADLLAQVPGWAPWVLGALVLLAFTLRAWRRHLTVQRKTQQEMSRLRAFAAIHETRANDLSTKIDHQQATTASLGTQLRSAEATIDSLRGRLAARPTDPADLEPLRERIAELEADNARLAEQEDARTGIEDLERRHARELERHADRIRELEAANTELARHLETGGGQEGDTAELIRLRTKVVGLEHAKADLERRRDELMQRISAVASIDVDGMREAISRLEAENAQLRRASTASQGRVIDLRSDPPVIEGAPVDVTSEPDLDEAADVLGYRIERDDLKAIDGIGPKIESLCHGIGITSWRSLADADPDDLRTMLEDAGPRYRVHDPASWTRQAELLATGRWDELRSMIAEVRTRRNR